MGLFNRKESAVAKSINARARFVNADVQRVDLTVSTADGEKVAIELTLDQVRQLMIEMTNAYSACRPALLDQKQVDRVVGYFGMR